jgi:hypothetical protein
MIRIVLAFVVVFGLFFFGIRAVRDMTGQERWDFAQLFTYSTICAILTVVSLTALVVLF